MMDDIVLQIATTAHFDTFNGDGFVMHLYGRMENGKSICVEINDFHPCLLLCLGDSQQSFFLHHGKRYVKQLKSFFPRETSGLLDDVSFVMKKKMFPYSSVHAQKFLRLNFLTEFSKKKTVQVIRNVLANPLHPLVKFGNFSLYDSNLSANLELFHELNMTPNSWIRVPIIAMIGNNDDNPTTCDLYARLNYTQIKIVDRCDIGPFRIGSFDIETLSHSSYLNDEAMFPDFRKPLDTISQIGTVTWIYGDQDERLYHRKVFLLDHKNAWFSGVEEVHRSYDLLKDGNDGWEEGKESEALCTHLIPCPDEATLLMQWAGYISSTDHDFLCGYNIFGFDFEYIYQRAIKLEIFDAFIHLLSRRKLQPNAKTSYYYITRNLASSAYGDNTMKLVLIPGRVSIDLYILIKKEFKLESYKLDDVSEHYLKRHKVDMKPAKLFKALMESKTSCTEAALYCAQDCLLVIELMRHLHTLPNLVGMANISRVTIDALVLRGQQVKVYSLICHEAVRSGYAVPDTLPGMKQINEGGDGGEEDEKQKYMGACVLDPKKGVYMTEHVTVLDFASLYPSLVIAYNLCYSTFVLPGNTRETMRQSSNEIQIEERKTHMFVKKDVREGLLPKILVRLWDERKRVKKQMKDCTNPLEHAVLNGRQLAIKVSMNSIYGFTGAINGMLPFRPIAESITGYGRQHIMLAKSKVEELYDCEVLYGDSDSIYVYLKGININEGESRAEQLAKVFQMSTAVQDCLNTFFVKPVEIEFEKIYNPFLLLSKKRYIALVYETPDPQKGHPEYKGVSIVRRDFCRFTRETLDESMRIVLYDRNVSRAYDYVSNRTKDLLEGRVPLDLLVMSKGLSAKYSYEANANPLPHVAVAAKMKLRDPNCYPKSGERVPFLFVNNGERLLKDRAEDPNYVKEHDINVDYLYYAENQLAKPCEEVFSILLNGGSFDLYRFVRTQMYLLRKRRDEEVVHAKNKRQGQQEITRFFSVRPRLS